MTFKMHTRYAIPLVTRNYTSAANFVANSISIQQIQLSVQSQPKKPIKMQIARYTKKSVER